MHLLSVHQIFLIYFILNKFIVSGDDNDRSLKTIKLIKRNDDYNPNHDFDAKLEQLPEFVKNVNRFDDPDEHWETFRYIKHFKKHKMSHKYQHGRVSPTITINGHRYVRLPKLYRPKKYFRKYRKYTSLPPYYKRYVRSHRLKDDLITEPSNNNNRYIGEATLPIYETTTKPKTKPQTKNNYENNVQSIKLPTTYLYPKYPETYTGYNMEQQNLNKIFKDSSKWFESELENDMMNDQLQESSPDLSTPSSLSTMQSSSSQSSPPSFPYLSPQSFKSSQSFSSTLPSSLFSPSSSVHNSTPLLSAPSLTSHPSLSSSKYLPSMFPFTYLPSFPYSSASVHSSSSSIPSSSSLKQSSSFMPLSTLTVSSSVPSSSSLSIPPYPDSDKAYSNTYFKPLTNLWKAIHPKINTNTKSKNVQNTNSLVHSKDNGITMLNTSNSFTPTEIVMPSLF